MRKLFSVSFVFIFSMMCNAQLPETDIWMIGLKNEKNGNIIAVSAKNLTNRPGYENQPCFNADDSKIIYSAAVGGQTDIHVQGVKSKKAVVFASTAESEYSPTFSPDGKSIIAVVVEKDSSQRIHYFNVKKKTDEGSLPIDSVGYFTFLNRDTLIFYKLTAPHTLQYYSLRGGSEKRLGDAPCRAFLKRDRHTVLYGLKDSLQTIFYTYDFVLQKARIVAKCQGIAEDFTWHPSLGLVRSHGTQLLAYNSTDQTWNTVFDLAPFGISKITRFVFSANGKFLAVVNNP
jgi:hypothetical protein